MSKFIQTTPLCVPSPLPSVLSQLCPVSSHSGRSVREPVEPPIVKHPRLETRHPPWEMTQSRRIWSKEEPDCATDNYHSLERERAACRLVGWSLLESLAAQRETTSFIPLSSYFKLVCPDLHWWDPTAGRPNPHSACSQCPSVPHPPSHPRPRLILVCVA